MGGTLDPSRPSGRASQPHPPSGKVSRPIGPTGRASRLLQCLQEVLPTLHGPWEDLLNPPDPPQPTGWASQPLLAFREGLTTPPMPPEPLWPSEIASSPSWPYKRAYQPLQSFREVLPNPPGPPGGPPEHLQPSGKGSRPLPAIQEGLPTPPCSLGGTVTLHGPTGGPPNPPGSPGRTPNPTEPFGRASQCLPTPPNPSRGPPDPSRLSRRDFRSHPALLEGLLILTAHLGGLLTPPSLATHPNPSQTSGRASQPFLALQAGLPTSPDPLKPSQPSERASQPLLAPHEGLPNPTQPSRRAS